MKWHEIPADYGVFCAIGTGATREVTVPRDKWSVNAGDAIRFAVSRDDYGEPIDRKCVRYVIAVEKGFADDDTVWLRDPAASRPNSASQRRRSRVTCGSSPSRQKTATLPISRSRCSRS